jgi:ribosomal protein S6--L-glutamate ligase
MKQIGVIGTPGAWSSECLADALAAKTGFRFLTSMESASLDLEKGAVFAGGQDLSELDGLVVKKIALQYSPDVLDRLEMLKFLELKGMPVFSRPSSILKLVDRLSCTTTLAAHGLPMPPTTVTEDVEAALDAVARYGKAVFKPLYSTKARGMKVIEDTDAARGEIARFKDEGNPVMYIQKLLPPLERDLGVTFLGGRYLATYARQASGGSWNTTTRSGGRYVAHEPSPEIVELAAKAQSLFDLSFTCVDVAETAGGPTIFEVSAFGGFRGLREACGLDAAATYANFALESVS